MAHPVRIGSFNAENLFARTKLLNLQSTERIGDLIAMVGELEAELRKADYDKPKIRALYTKLKDYVEIVVDRGKFFGRSHSVIAADGFADWDGFIRFRKAPFSEEARKNTARVIRAMNADILCLVEIEDRLTLQRFCTDRLTNTATFKKYNYHMCLDGNDDRGIDVAIVSRWPIGQIRTHIYDTDADGTIFSRDCFEVEIQHPSGVSIWVLANHFKSKLPPPAASDARRKRQAAQVAQVLARFNMAQDFVVVAGDLNDDPGNAPLAPLIAVPDLHQVLATQFPNAQDRWTYYYARDKAHNQLDHLLVSSGLDQYFHGAGIDRRGIFDLAKISTSGEKSFDTVKVFKDAASDHAAIWADFILP
jgi:endonuclease/exonuclease/phosphatase family metal-dependent hydrolase